ncbi:hypothetical protein CsSME_00008944 [Camellia sinensis var. sinensis]
MHIFCHSFIGSQIFWIWLLRHFDWIIFKLQVCQLEHQLFDHFFPSSSEDMSSLAPLIDPLLNLQSFIGFTVGERMWMVDKIDIKLKERERERVLHLLEFFPFIRQFSPIVFFCNKVFL